jgi:Fe-S-cluster containining protein
VTAPNPCADCRGPCCFDAAVELTGADLWRLVRALGIPWQDAAIAAPSEPGFALRLKQRANGACVFAVELADEFTRCGVHALKPLRCRVYPYYVEHDPPAYRVGVGTDARCPELQARAFAAARGWLDDDVAEQALEARARRRFAAVVPPVAVTADRYVDWVLRLHDALAPLRAAGSGREAWQLAAYRVIDEFPAP